MINFDPFPNLETEHLLLRKLTFTDSDDLFEMRKDPRVHEFTDTRVDENIGQTRAYINKMNQGVAENKWILWAIEHKQLHQVIGSVSIWNINRDQESGELGYGVRPDFQGQGWMKESLLCVAGYGFGVMKLRELWAYTEENNLRSIKLLEKCHFVEVKRVEEMGVLNKRVYAMVAYRLGAI